MSKSNILFICSIGLGSSFVAQISTEDISNKLGIEAKLDHYDISSTVSMKPDVVIIAENFRSQSERLAVDPKATATYLKNIVSKDEIEEKIAPVLQDKGVV